MKLLYTLAALLCITLAPAQNIKTLNKGKATQKNYNISVPYTDINGLMIVQASIEGKDYNFMVDTGAITTISQELYEALGLKSHAAINVRDSSNLIDSLNVVTLPAVQVGGIAFKDVPAVVAQGGFFFDCLGIDGFIGSNMLRNSVVKFSHRDKTINITDKLKNFSVSKSNIASLREDKFQSNPHMTINLKGDGYDINELLLFDTGMVGLYDLSLPVHEQTLSQAGVFTVLHRAKGAFSIGLNGVETPTEHSMLLIPELTFAGVTLKNVTTETTSNYQSRIGTEVLKYGDVVIDYPHGQLYFNPYTGGPVDVTEKKWPVQPVMDEDKLVVGIVWDDAYSDRINHGDEILKFGKYDFANLSICDIFRQNRKPDTDTAVMVLKDATTGEIKEVELVRE